MPGKNLMDEARAAVRNEPPAEPTDAPAWEVPTPLAGRHAPAPFPLDALPADLAAFVSDVAGATNTPTDYPGAFALAVAAGVAGATRAVEIKEGHVQRASLYVCAVARKGSGKTPALDAVCEPLYDEQARRRRAGDKAKAFVSDVTAEKLAELLNQDPRGLLLVRDELAGWLLSFNQYKAGGHGSDRQFFLSAWSGSPVAVDRKNKDAEPVYVRFPCLSVVGTIQPAVLERFRADADDGFYDRVLFTFPDEPPMVGEQWLTVSRAKRERWAEAVAELRRIPMQDGTDGARPYFLRLAPAARERWQDWTADVAAQVNGEDFDEALRGPAVKLSGYAARLALVSHSLRQVYGDRVTNEIDGEDMRRGVALAVYFLDHAVRAWAAAGIDQRFGPARKVLAWLARLDAPTTTRRDAWRGLRKSFADPNELSGPLKTLVDHGYLRYAPADPKDRRAAVVYEINPSVRDANLSPVSPASPVTAVTLSPGCDADADAPHVAGDR